MIRMIQSSSAAHAKAYFKDELSRSDYYVDDQELQGKIQGLLAERIGIRGQVTKDLFDDLCDNINPRTGKTLTPRTKDDRTVGYDINFHCPKSVSILHALSKDDHIMKAFEESVRKTMQDIERDSKTRVRTIGRDEERLTGELLWVDFTHQTARPVDGSMPDPHLHAHCFVFNATWDEQEQRIKACQFRDIKRDMPYYEARFQKYLSDAMIHMGYEIEATRTAFEVKGVPKSVIGLFSKRTDEIGRAAKEKGITDAKELSELGARTRSKKQKGHSMEDLRNEWRRQIHEHSENGGKQENPVVRYAKKEDKSILTPEQCVAFAVNHGFERASVLQDRRLLASAYRYSIGHATVSLDMITENFMQDSRLIHVEEKGKLMTTTKEVLAEEQRMVRLARQGQGKLRPLYSQVPQTKLQGEQKAAIEHVLSTTNRVSIVTGKAGTGKTTTLSDGTIKIIADYGLTEKRRQELQKNTNWKSMEAPTLYGKGVLTNDNYFWADNNDINHYGGKYASNYKSSKVHFIIPIKDEKYKSFATEGCLGLISISSPNEKVLPKDDLKNLKFYNSLYNVIKGIESILLEYKSSEYNRQNPSAR